MYELLALLLPRYPDYLYLCVRKKVVFERGEHRLSAGMRWFCFNGEQICLQWVQNNYRVTLLEHSVVPTGFLTPSRDSFCETSIMPGSFIPATSHSAHGIAGASAGVRGYTKCGRHEFASISWKEGISGTTACLVACQRGVSYVTVQRLVALYGRWRQQNASQVDLPELYPGS